MVVFDKEKVKFKGNNINYPNAAFTAGLTGAAGTNFNTYGAYFNNVSTVSGSGVNDGIYAIGSKNYLSGSLGIGVTAATDKLNVVAISGGSTSTD